ncbi:twitching motility protein PilT, partial [Burkholderia pseudomallei]
MVTVTFRFYEELIDFLARPVRRREFAHECVRGGRVKNAIDAVGV